MTSDLYYIHLGFTQTAPEVLFDNPKTKDDVAKTFKKLAIKFHPDKHAGDREDTKWANNIFTLLCEYRDALDNLIEKGITPGKVEFEIAIGKRKIKFTDVIHEGDLGLVVRNGSDVLKILRDPSDSDLYRNAEKHLRKLRGHEHFDQYLIGKITPVSVNMGGVIHPGQHYQYVEGYTLEQVKEKYPITSAPHSTWMLNRILEILCHAHSNGIANLGVLPRHILIIPETHGGVLLDWTCSTTGKPIAVADTESFGKYPDFVFDKPDDARYADVVMAFDIYKWLAGEDNIPSEIKNFYRNIYSGYYRGRNTIEIYKRFQKVVDSVWKRTFMPFTMD